MKLYDDFYATHIKGSSVFSRPVMQQSTLAAVVSMLIYMFCQRPDARLNNVGENGEMYFRCVPSALGATPHHPPPGTPSCSPSDLRPSDAAAG